jgi:hypothetical protein
MTTDPTPRTAATARDALWEEEARRYAQNADYWRERFETLAAAEAPGRVAALEAVAAAAASFIRRWDDRKYIDAADMVGHCWESIGALRDALAAPAPTPSVAERNAQTGRNVRAFLDGEWPAPAPTPSEPVGRCPDAETIGCGHVHGDAVEP